MSESFVPLAPPATKSAEPAFTSLDANRSATSPGGPKEARSQVEGCSKPVITLRRNGEIVSGIRIQCGCGQVVDLACVY